VEPDVPIAPPVVAVVVVHRPDTWFADTLDALADQDYPNLDTLFLVTGDPDVESDGLRAMILDRLPSAYVRELGTNPGFGPAANEVVRLVEGESGFFCFCHDDVALEPDAVRLLVEEMYRSNAGIVGPKLVSWDDAGLLQHVGLGLDRFGEVDPITEPGEYDQEQHDAVRDVFALPSACLLVRADLFRELGGFDPAVDFHGEDIDLCWRAHLNGARVVVAPAAVARHRERLELRRPDVDHRVLRARHRMRSVATLTAGARLPLRALEIVLLTVAELAVGLFSGRFAEAWASLRAVVGLLPRAPSLLARRRAVRRLRQVPEAEVQDLQNRGSARLTSYRRARDTETYVDDGAQVRRWRERSLGSPMAWIVVILAILAASRTFIDTRVPAVGELLPLPDSPRQLLGDYASSWSPGGLGVTSPNPTGWAVLSLVSVAWLFRMGLGLTVLVVGSILLGAAGAWRLAGVYPSTRARVTALVVYAAMPLVPGVISTGRSSALVAYASAPWFVHLVRSAAGVGTADPAAADIDLVDGVLPLTARERIRRISVAGLAVAVSVAFAPAVLAMFVGVAVVLALTTVVAWAGWRTAAWMLIAGIAACGIGWVLNLPWSATLSWDDVVGPTLAGAPGRGLADVASMSIGEAELEVLALALYVPVIVALTLARAWRLTWAIRAAGLVLGFGALAVLQDRDALPVRLPEVGVLLAPVAVGLAIAAASTVAAFGSDVRGRGFGWRQPLGLIGCAAVAIGVFPCLLSVVDGAWFTPRTTMTSLLDAQLPSVDEVGDHRVMFVGDPRLVPVPSTDLGDGVSMAVVGAGPLMFDQRWSPPSGDADDVLAATVEQIAASTTQRGGSLLAPFGIRYVVVPLIDGAVSTAAEPVPPPDGLLEAFGDQLDLVLAFAPPNYTVFENRSAIPTVALLTGEAAEANRSTSVSQRVGADLSAAAPVFDGLDARSAAAGDVDVGTVHLAVPFDDRWQFDVGGDEVPSRAGFGVLTAYDVEAAGEATLDYRSSTSRTAWLAVQVALWLLVAVAASRIAVPTRLRSTRIDDETLIDLDADAPAAIDTTTGVPAAQSAGHVGLPPPISPTTRHDEPSWVDELLADDVPASADEQERT